MSRYADMFDRLGSEGAFGAFVMLGDPSAPPLDVLVEAGADMLEVGIPFSDPVADGPVIQAAAQRALAAGIRVDDCLAQIRAFRDRDGNTPVGILTYANIVTVRAGFMRDAAEAGADSVLIADVPTVEADRFVGDMEQAGIEPVLIAAANTPDETLARIAALSEAYTYVVSRAGITGTHSGGEFEPELIERLNRAGAPPPVFGFGISRPEHVRAAFAAGARGVICGSAIVDAAQNGGDVAALVRSLKSATGNESAPQ